MKKKVLSWVIIFMLVLCSGCTNGAGGSKSTATTQRKTGETLTQSELSGIPAAYEETLADFKALLEWRLVDDFFEKYDQGTAGEPLLSDNLKAQLSGVSEETTHLETNFWHLALDMDGALEDVDFGYILKDINGDDVPELFWMRSDRFILAVFTVCEGKAKLLDAFSNLHEPYECVMLDNNRLHISTYIGAGVYYDYILKLDKNGKLENDLSFFRSEFGGDGISSFYKEKVADADWTDITEEQYEQLLAQYPFELGSEWEALPITFFEETTEPEQTLSEKLTAQIEAELENKLQNAADGMYYYHLAYDTCAQEWKEVAEQYYDAIMAYEGCFAEWEEMSGNDRIIEDFRAAMEEYKSAWEEYEQSQGTAYDTIIGTIYGGGSLGSIAFSEHHYDHCKQWALQVVEIYELMLNLL